MEAAQWVTHVIMVNTVLRTVELVGLSLEREKPILYALDNMSTCQFSEKQLQTNKLFILESKYLTSVVP